MIIFFFAITVVELHCPVLHLVYEAVGRLPPQGDEVAGHGLLVHEDDGVVLLQDEVAEVADVHHVGVRPEDARAVAPGVVVDVAPAM